MCMHIWNAYLKYRTYMYGLAAPEENTVVDPDLVAVLLIVRKQRLLTIGMGVCNKNMKFTFGIECCYPLEE